MEQELKREGLDSAVGKEKRKAQMLHRPQAWGFLPQDPRVPDRRQNVCWMIHPCGHEHSTNNY